MAPGARVEVLTVKCAGVPSHNVGRVTVCRHVDQLGPLPDLGVEVAGLSIAAVKHKRQAAGVPEALLGAAIGVVDHDADGAPVVHIHLQPTIERNTCQCHAHRTTRVSA